MRPYCTVIVWEKARKPIRSRRMFCVMTHGTIRDIKRHRDMTPNGFSRAVSKAMADGFAVTFEVCKADFQVAQRAEYQRQA